MGLGKGDKDILDYDRVKYRLPPLTDSSYNHNHLLPTSATSLLNNSFQTVLLSTLLERYSISLQTILK